MICKSCRDAADGLPAGQHCEGRCTCQCDPDHPTLGKRASQSAAEADGGRDG